MADYTEENIRLVYAHTKITSSWNKSCPVFLNLMCHIGTMYEKIQSGVQDKKNFCPLQPNFDANMPT